MGYVPAEGSFFSAYLREDVPKHMISLFITNTAAKDDTPIIVPRRLCV